MWRRIPPALLVGLAIRIVFDLANVVHFVHPQRDGTLPWEILEYGIDVVVSCLIISGALQLAKQGGHRLGTYIVIGAELAHLSVFSAFVGLTYWIGAHDPEPGAMRALEYVSYASAVASVTSAIGFGLISRSRVIAIGLALASVAGVPGLWLALARWGDGLGFSTVMVARLLPYALLAFGALVATVVGVRSLEPPADEPAAPAFALAARSLWLRVMAAVALAAITLLAMSAGSGFSSLFKLATIVAPVVDALALAGFARAALGLSRANVSRWTSVAAAVGALWCVGVILSRIPHAYELAYRRQEIGGGFIGMFNAHESAPLATAFATTVPLVATVAIGLVLIAITTLARRRDLDALHETARVRTGAFVVLALGALVIARYGLVWIGYDAVGGLFLVGVIAAAGSSLYALVIAAKLCEQAHATVSLDPTGLPAATLIKESSK